MKKIIIGLFMVFCCTAGITSVLACVCVPTQGVRKEFKAAGAVFSGKFIGTEYRKSLNSEVITSNAETTGPKAELETLVLKFQIENWWKGKRTKQVVLFTDRTRAPDGSETVTDCDFPFEVGKRYLVYAFSSENQFKTNLCTRTREIGKAREDLKILGKGRKPGRR